MLQYTTEPQLGWRIWEIKIAAIYAQLNKVETRLPHRRPVLMGTLWSPLTTPWLGSFTILSQMKQSLEYGGGGGTSRPLPRDGGMEELRENPTVGLHLKVWTISQE